LLFKPSTLDYIGTGSMTMLLMSFLVYGRFGVQISTGQSSTEQTARHRCNNYACSCSVSYSLGSILRKL